MFKPERNLDYLYDIQEAIERILSYAKGLSWDEYLQDRKTQDAIVRNLEVLGEATKNLTNEIRQQYPSVPWQEMAGTRDRLIHHYFGINQEIVWQIVQNDLPGLKDQVLDIIQSLVEGE